MARGSPDKTEAGARGSPDKTEAGARGSPDKTEAGARGSPDKTEAGARGSPDKTEAGVDTRLRDWLKEMGFSEHSVGQFAGRDLSSVMYLCLCLDVCYFHHSIGPCGTGQLFLEKCCV